MSGRSPGGIAPGVVFDPTWSNLQSTWADLNQLVAILEPTQTQKTVKAIYPLAYLINLPMSVFMLFMKPCWAKWATSLEVNLGSIWVVLDPTMLVFGLLGALHPRGLHFGHLGANLGYLGPSEGQLGAYMGPGGVNSA